MDKEHKIIISLDEIGKISEGLAVGVGLKYRGPNKDGLTKKLALSAIGAILTAVDSYSLEAMTTIAEKLGIGLCDYKRFNNEKEAREALEKNSCDNTEITLKSLKRILADERWTKVLTGEKKINKSPAKICALVATALEMIKDKGDTKWFWKTCS